jgi:glycosyltransferase involved in cell wall biosynthesis
MQNIKVLHIIHWPKSGIVNLVYNQITSTNKNTINYKVGFLIKNQDTFRKFNKAGIEVSNYDFNLVNYLGTFKRIVKDIRETKPVIIHTHSFLPGIIVRIISLFNKSFKLVATIHNSYPYFSRKTFKDKIKTFIEINSLNMAKSKIICVSKFVKEHLLKNTKINPDLICIIYPGISIKKEVHSQNYEEQNGVIVVGRLDDQKRHDRLLYIWKEVVDKIPQAKLNIVGDGTEKKKLLNLCAKLNLSQNVNFLGFREDIPELFASSRFSVLSSSFEGLPLVVIESFLQKKTVIAFDIGPMCEIIDEGCGILVTPFNIDEFAEKIVFLLKNKDISTSLGNNGCKKIKDIFRIERMIEQIENKYTELVNKNGQ